MQSSFTFLPSFAQKQTGSSFTRNSGGNSPSVSCSQSSASRHSRLESEAITHLHKPQFNGFQTGCLSQAVRLPSALIAQPETSGTFGHKMGENEITGCFGFDITVACRSLDFVCLFLLSSSSSRHLKFLHQGTK